MDDFDSALSALNAGAPKGPSNNPGNLRPVGASTGFQSFNSPEDGLKAMDDNLKAYHSKGINTISGVINRWAPPSENNTPAYVSDVSKRLGIAPDAQIDLSNPIVRHALTTAITLHENGSRILTQQSPPQAQATPAAQPAADDDFSGALAALDKASTPSPQPVQPAKAEQKPALNANGATPWFSPGTGSAGRGPSDPHAPISSPEADLTLNQATGLGSTVVGGLGGLYSAGKTLLKGGSIDDAIKAGTDTAHSIQQAGTYQPRTEQGAKMVEQFGSNYNPLSWIPNASQAAGNAGGTALENAGYPAAGAFVKGAGAAAPLAIGLGMKKLSSVVKGDATEVPPKIEPTFGDAVSSAVGGGKPRYKMVNGKPVLIEQGGTPETVSPLTPNGPTPTPQSVPLSQVGKTQPPPAAPVPQTPQAVQTIAQTAPQKLFPETPTSAGEPGVKFSPAEQANRGRILQSVGIDPNSIRTSSLTGDALAGATDFQTSKIDSTAGRLMKNQLDMERNALIDHSSQLVKETGGTTGLDQSNLYARGNAIIAPLDSMKAWFDNKTSALYKAADERAQGVPTQLNGFKSILEDASERTNSDRVLLPDAVTSYAKKLGMVQEDGSISGTAQQAETLRKYLNENWSPQNSGLVGKLKDALDNDVMSAAGSDIYGQARALRAQRAATLDNPKGIAQLMDSSGPEGINRAVSVEKIPDKLTGLSVDQFSHVIKTLKNAPPELQPQANAALSEIKAQFANKVREIGSKQAGQWDAKGVTNYLQGNAARMAQVFTPEEIAKFRNLNDAGHILAKDQSYPGAAIQGHNLMTQGVMHGLQAGGAGMGAAIGGPLGGAAGAFVGRAAANAVGNAAAARAVKGRMTKLSDLVGTEK